jgi:hypothetical protein
MSPTGEFLGTACLEVITLAIEIIEEKITEKNFTAL